MQKVRTTDLAQIADRLTTILSPNGPVGFEMCPNEGLPTFYISMGEREVRLPLVKREPAAAIPVTEVPKVVQKIQVALQGDRVFATKGAMFVQANGVLENCFLTIPRRLVRR